MVDYEATSRRLRSWMTDKGWDGEETAKRLGITYGKLKGWLYGGRDMGLDGACLVCNVFGKSIDELVCRDEKEAV